MWLIKLKLQKKNVKDLSYATDILFHDSLKGHTLFNIQHLKYSHTSNISKIIIFYVCV